METRRLEESNLLTYIEQAERNIDLPNELIKNTNLIYSKLEKVDEVKDLINKKELNIERIQKLNKKRADVFINTITELVCEKIQRLSAQDLADAKSFEPSLTADPAKELEEFYETHLPMFIQDDILSIENLEHRNLIIEQWIFAAQECLRRNNLFVAKSIYLALGQACIIRLIESKEKKLSQKYIGISEKAMAALDDIQETFLQEHMLINRVKLTSEPILFSISSFAATTRKLAGQLQNWEFEILKCKEKKEKEQQRLLGLTILANEKNLMIESINNNINILDDNIKLLNAYINDAVQTHTRQCEKDFQIRFLQRDYSKLIDKQMISTALKESIKEHQLINNYILANRSFAYYSSREAKICEQIQYIESDIKDLTEKKNLLLADFKLSTEMSPEYQADGRQILSPEIKQQNEQLNTLKIELKKKQEKSEELSINLAEMLKKKQKKFLRQQEFVDAQSALSYKYVKSTQEIKKSDSQLRESQLHKIPGITGYLDISNEKYFENLADKVCASIPRLNKPTLLPHKHSKLSLINNNSGEDSECEMREFRTDHIKKKRLSRSKSLSRKRSNSNNNENISSSEIKSTIKKFALYGTKINKAKTVEDILMMLASKTYTDEDKLKFLYMSYMNMDQKSVKQYSYLKKIIEYYEANQKIIVEQKIELIPSSGCDAFDQEIIKLKSKQNRKEVKYKAKLSILEPIQIQLSKILNPTEKIKYIEAIIPYVWLETELSLLKSYKNELVSKKMSIPLEKKLSSVWKDGILNSPLSQPAITNISTSQSSDSNELKPTRRRGSPSLQNTPLPSLKNTASFYNNREPSKVNRSPNKKRSTDNSRSAPSTPESHTPQESTNNTPRFKQ